MKVYVNCCIAVIFLFISGGMVHARTCLKVFSGGHAVTSPGPSDYITDLFTQIDQRPIGLERRVSFYIEELETLKKSNQSSALTKKDLLYIASKLVSVAGYMNPKDLISIFNFFGSYHFKIPSNDLKSFTNRVKQTIDYFSARDLTYLLSSIAKSDIKMPSSFKSIIENSFNKNRGSYNSQELTFLAMHYVKIFGVHSSVKFIKDIEKTYIGIHNQFNFDQTLTILKVLSHSYTKPSKRFLNLTLKQLKTKLSSDNIFDLILVFVSINSPLPDIFRSDWIPYLLNNLSDLSSNQITELVYALYLLGEFDLVQAVSESPLIKIEIDHLNKSSKGRIHLVQMYFTHVLKQEDLLFSIDVSAIAPATFDHADTISSIEATVKDWLVLQNVGFHHEFQVASGNYVDFYLPHNNTIIQVDGPHHFIKLENGEIRLRFKDIRFNELHEALGYSVVRINYLEIMERTNRNSK